MEQKSVKKKKSFVLTTESLLSETDTYGSSRLRCASVIYQPFSSHCVVTRVPGLFLLPLLTIMPPQQHTSLLNARRLSTDYAMCRTNMLQKTTKILYWT